MSKAKLLVIFKISNLCPMKCSYCYYFNNNGAQCGEVVVSKKTVKMLVCFLQNAIREKGITDIDIWLHGGEPLTAGKSFFSWMSQFILKNLSKLCNFRLSLQTNGVLIDEDWIRIFEKYNIRVGVSLDGPSEYHNKNRILKSGVGSYAIVSKNIKLLQKHNLLQGILTVVDPSNDPKKIFDHFVNDLNINFIDFLFLDITHESVELTTEYLMFCKDFWTKLFHVWITYDDPSIKIGIFDKFLKGLVLGSCCIEQGYLITVLPNGDFYYNDELLTASQEFTDFGLNLSNSSFADFLKHKKYLELIQIEKTIPSACKSCKWIHLCSSMCLINRYNKKNGFNNKNVYCEVLKALYLSMEDYIQKNSLTVKSANLENNC